MKACMLLGGTAWSQKLTIYQGQGRYIRPGHPDFYVDERPPNHVDSDDEDSEFGPPEEIGQVATSWRTHPTRRITTTGGTTRTQPATGHTTGHTTGETTSQTTSRSDREDVNEKEPNSNSEPYLIPALDRILPKLK
ncbi:hypothetical protein SLS53_002741 [Cytospora paraplurivora]|uniref:Uncharacterized protein n=1 Tax=Cytospora paraplurivora TaxID=2898453 RepID=A0AAN9UD23_9PEZI